MMKKIFLLVIFVFVSQVAIPQTLPSERERERRIQNLVEMTKSNPKDVGAWHDLAFLYLEAKRWDEAIKAESKAIEGHPKYAVAYYGRGRAQMEKKNFDAARADFSKAISLWEARGGLQDYLTIEQPQEEYIRSYRYRGMSWAEEKKFDAALKDLSIAIQLDKDNARIYYDRASVEEKMGKKKEAIADYKYAGLLYFDKGYRKPVEECLADLIRLQANSEAEDLKKKLEGSKVSSEKSLPDL